VFRERVFHLRRHDGINFAANDVITLQVAQVLSQHFLGHARNQLAKLSESFGSTFQIKQDQRLPLAADYVRG
jgi:hypothetical protein